MLCFGSLLLVPILLMAHPPVDQMARNFVLPGMPEGKLSDIMLLVGTTVARGNCYSSRAMWSTSALRLASGMQQIDLLIGIVLVMLGGIALMAFTVGAFSGTPEFGNFTDAGGIAAGLAACWPGRKYTVRAGADQRQHPRRIRGVARQRYAIGDVLAVRHSLHRKPTKAMGST